MGHHKAFVYRAAIRIAQLAFMGVTFIPREIDQRFGKGVGGRGLATNRTQNTAKMVPLACVPPSSKGGIRTKRAEKWSESWAKEGSPRSKPLCPPTPIRFTMELIT